MYRRGAYINAGCILVAAAAEESLGGRGEEGAKSGERRLERETRRTPEGAHTATTQAVHTQSANPPVGLGSIHLKERGDGSYEQYGEHDEQLGREVAGELPLCLHRAERS